jgi:imidazolonepropionase-like amidohydrolase
MPDCTLAGGRLVDGTGVEAVDDAVIVIRDGRVDRVGPSSDGSPPGPVIDLGGRTVLPGLIDAHVHLKGSVDRGPGFGPPPPRTGETPRPDELRWFVLAKSARAFLEGGVTTVRDVGSYGGEALVVDRAVRLGLVPGPRIVSCGRIISATAPGGAEFTTMYREADGPWAMRRAVRENLRLGAGFIKFMATGARSVELEDPEPAQMTRDEMDAIVDEAHRMGVRVAAHAEGLEGTRWAIEAGVDTVEHGLALHRDPALLAEMAARGTVLVPTLSTFHDVAERFADRFAPSLVDLARRQTRDAARTLVAARDAGVVLAMGYDSGPPGANAAELVRLVEAGLSPLDGIRAATQGSARALGLTDVGTVEAGHRADLLIVDGDPVADPRVLADPDRRWLVLQDGCPVAGRACDTPDPLGMR